MKNLTIFFASIVLVFGVSNAVVAQADDKTANHDVTIEVPSFAILDIEGGDNVVLDVDIAELEAGERVNFEGVSNSNAWLNYTVIISDKKTREITANLKSDDLPSGVSLVLDVADAVNGVGSIGTVLGQKSFTLESNSKKIITSIGSSYTQNGTGHGHNLTYKLKMNDDNFGSLVSGTNYSATVVYTFADVN